MTCEMTKTQNFPIFHFVMWKDYFLSLDWCPTCSMKWAMSQFHKILWSCRHRCMRHCDPWNDRNSNFLFFYFVTWKNCFSSLDWCQRGANVGGTKQPKSNVLVCHVSVHHPSMQFFVQKKKTHLISHQQWQKQGLELLLSEGLKMDMIFFLTCTRIPWEEQIFTCALIQEEFEPPFCCCQSINCTFLPKFALFLRQKKKKSNASNLFNIFLWVIYFNFFHGFPPSWVIIKNVSWWRDDRCFSPLPSVVVRYSWVHLHVHAWHSIHPWLIFFITIVSPAFAPCLPQMFNESDIAGSDIRFQLGMHFWCLPDSEKWR